MAASKAPVLLAFLGRLRRPEGVYRGVSPGRVPGCTEPRLRSLAVDSSAGEDQLVPASRVSAWERVRPRPGLGGSGVQPPPENSPCLVPRAPLAEGAAEADRLALSKKQKATLFLHPAPAPRGAGEEEETPAFCAGDSWARLGIFPGCGHPGVTHTPRGRRVPGSWSRPGPDIILEKMMERWYPEQAVQQPFSVTLKIEVLRFSRRPGEVLRRSPLGRHSP